MFVAAIQDENGARPSRAPSKPHDLPAPDPQAAVAGASDLPAAPETAFPAEPVPVLGS